MLSFFGVALAQIDTVAYDAATATLRYQIDYNRAAATAERLECSQETLENGLVHSAIRHLFLFLPYAATFYPDVETLEVVVSQKQDGDITPVLRLSAPLAQIRQTNSEFRTYMNSFASLRAGFCFAQTADRLELWLKTLEARQGLIEVNDEVFAFDVPHAMAFSQVADTVASDETDASVSYSLVPYFSDLRVLTFSGVEEVLEPDEDYAAILETSAGTMLIDLFEAKATQTVNNFVFLARNHFYDGVAFHRVIPGFIAQTGDPTGTGFGGPGYSLEAEINPSLDFDQPGMVAMTGSGANTNASQFFITMAPAPELEDGYSIFGQVIEGLEVLSDLNASDSAQPLTVALPGDSLGLLATQGVRLSGDGDMTLGSFLEQQLGGEPELGQRYSLGGYDVMVTADPESGDTLVAFWPTADWLERVTIVTRDE